jgi:DNA mismatch endonuclease, patch repair protein
MRANRRADTAPEVRLRSLLHRAGSRFRKDHRIPLERSFTRADIVFTSERIAVFVDGCFWHGCPRHGTQPRHNAWYWGPKLARNRARDKATSRALRRAGWTVLRFWEHTAADEAAARILSHLGR